MELASLPLSLVLSLAVLSPLTTLMTLAVLTVLAALTMLMSDTRGDVAGKESRSLKIGEEACVDGVGSGCGQFLSSSA